MSDRPSPAFPLLADGDVRVRPFEAEHLTARYVAWLNDPEVVRYSEQRHRHHTLESCGEYFAAQRESADYFLAIETDALGHVGNLGVSVDRHNHLADMAIVLGERSVWGQRVATRAWSLVLRQLLDQFGFRKVTAGTMATNTAMLRLMDRTGMTVECIRPRHFLWEGKEVDMVQAAAYSERWTLK